MNKNVLNVILARKLNSRFRSKYFPLMLPPKHAQLGHQHDQKNPKTNWQRPQQGTTKRIKEFFRSIRQKKSFTLKQENCSLRHRNIVEPLHCPGEEKKNMTAAPWKEKKSSKISGDLTPKEVYCTTVLEGAALGTCVGGDRPIQFSLLLSIPLKLAMRRRADGVPKAPLNFGAQGSKKIARNSRSTPTLD